MQSILRNFISIFSTVYTYLFSGVSYTSSNSIYCTNMKQNQILKFLVSTHQYQIFSKSVQ